MSLALIALLPFLGALLPGLLARFGRSVVALGCAAMTGVALFGVLVQAPVVLAGGIVQSRLDWVPILGLAVTFRLDGLSLLFAGLILGMGLLIQLYARFYLSAGDSAVRFFAGLMLFQGAMLGIVLADNLLLLLVFWELTSIASFLLIGYWSHLPQARRGAVMALAVTGAGGLALIAGLLILGQIAGSYELSVILRQAEAVQASPLYLPALLLILAGAFAKSAQVPFQVWLPQAMAAPTPVSAYLHSATMVKAGIYLLARLWPVLAGRPEWVVIVSCVGLATLLLGAWVAFFKEDLKALLAYSTISQLGLITLLLGLGTEAAAVAAVFHILNHAVFKAALFMVAGIVDHAAHSRSLARLGGLARLMPLSSVLAGLAALSMAGIPPLNGFLSKEMLLEAALHGNLLGSDWLLSGLVTLGAALSVGYSLRFLSHGFLGSYRGDAAHIPHDPGVGLWAAPAVLCGLVLAIGLAPMALAGGLVAQAAQAVTGQPVTVHLALWHGADAPALWLSLAAVGGGLIWLGAERRLQRLPVWPEAADLFDNGLRALIRAAQAATAAQRDGRLTRLMAVVVCMAAGLAAVAWITAPVASPVVGWPALVWLGLAAPVLALPVLHAQRYLALILLGLVGLVVSAGFVWLSAPDLALTQISVEVVTVILLLLALHILPSTARPDPLPRRLRDAMLAGLAGLGLGAISLLLLTRPPLTDPISAFHLAQSVPGAGGANAVNTIIVDFRGYDTYGEILVLAIAGLIIVAVADGLRGVKVPGRQHPDAGDPHPVMFTVASRLLLPLVLTVGVHLFLRGHNLPGGGFVAGLVFAIALVMQWLASGLAWTQRRQRLKGHALIGAGALIATTIGVWPMLGGRPFLSSDHGHVDLPVLHSVELATAMLFDLGVFLCVLGAVVLALQAIARLPRPQES